MTTVTPPADSEQTVSPEYVRDRYDRLKKCAHEYATGSDFGDNFVTGEMIEALAVNLTIARVLDGLSEHDANTVSMLTILDFPRGLPHMAWRLTDWMSENRSVGDRHDENEFAVVSVLARVLAIVAAAFVDDEFEKLQQHHPVDCGGDQ